MRDAELSSISSEILKLLQSLPNDWTTAEREEVKHFVDVGECGLALETVVGIVIEEGRPLPAVARIEVETLADRMGILQGDSMSELRSYLAKTSGIESD